MATATFTGGVHPPEKKEISKNSPIENAPEPEKVVIPLSQHTGAPAKPVVNINESVKKGQLIGEPQGFVSAAVHSSVSGKVIAIENVLLPTGRYSQAIVIENDGKDAWFALEDNPDYMELSTDVMKERIKNAGIVGLGGAAFPTHVKLSPPQEKPIDTVIINAAECEPYLTADYRLTLERSKEIVEGLRIIMKILGVKRGIIAVEDNKLDAAKKIEEAVRGMDGIMVMTLKTKYPQGAEKMLIKATIQREIPPRRLPMDVGVVVQNAGTAFAIYEAVRFNKPLIERVVTVTGMGVKRPKNLLVKIGTLFSNLIDYCGGFSDGVPKIVAGGPMMGFAIPSLDIPVTKGTSGIVVLSEREFVHAEDYKPCIRCGRCVDVCPMGLMPSILSIMGERDRFEEMKEYNLFDCFECGTCTFVCPAKRPIVQLIRLGKSMVKP